MKPKLSNLTTGKTQDMTTFSNQLPQTLDRISRVVSFIEKNLDQNLTVNSISHEACYSPFHFQRHFKEHCCYKLMEYVRKRILTHAAHKIISTNISLTNIALNAGFETHSSFSRAFKHQYGFTPREYRNNNISYWFQDLKPLKDNQLEYLNTGGITLKPKIIFQPEMTLFGLPFEHVTFHNESIEETRTRLLYLLDSHHVRVDKTYQVEFSQTDDVLQFKAVGFIGVKLNFKLVPADLINKLIHFQVPAGKAALFIRRITNEYWAQRYIFENWARMTSFILTYQYVMYEKLSRNNVFYETIKIPVSQIENAKCSESTLTMAN